MNTRVDVLVIGGGPAGSLVASLVRRQDPQRTVMIVEREHFPRHHVGESSIPSWRPILERAGVLEKIEAAGFMPKVGTLFHWGEAADESWTLDFRDPATGGPSRGSVQVDRARLDRLLLDHARELGAEVVEGAQVQHVERDEDRFRVAFLHGDVTSECSAQFVVDASGHARLLSRLFRLRVDPFDDMNNFAVFGYWQGSEIAQLGKPIREGERWTYITTCPDGWVWHIPIAPDLVSVGVVTDARSLPHGAGELAGFYERNVRAAPGVGDLLRRATLSKHPNADRPLHTVRDWSYRTERLCGPGWFLVGDAAAFVDPILSSGLLLAANGASMVANALHTLWNDAGVDADLLRESYDTTYLEMVGSYHALARIWYSRNFKYDTWHWEAKRQRLRTGRDIDEERAADAFMQLCIGSFANPVEGAFAKRGLLADMERPDAYIYASHLYPDRGGIRADLLDAAKRGVDNEVARQRIKQEASRRWTEIVQYAATLQGCTFVERDGYFSDGTMSRWQRVHFVEVRPDGERLLGDRVVFPSMRGLPSGIMPMLDGRQSLGSLFRSIVRTVPINSEAYETYVQALYQQATQLAFRGWLVRGERLEEPASERIALPPTLATVLRPYASKCSMTVGWLGESLEIDVGDDANRVVLMPVERVDRKRCFAVAGATGIAFRGKEPTDAGRRVLESLRVGLMTNDFGTFWTKDVLAAAGRHLRLAPDGYAE